MQPKFDSTGAYRLAQRALADLKAAVHAVLSESGPDGLRNAEIGRLLGIYHGHSKRGAEHVGHIPRVLLELMKMDGVVEQDPQTTRWKIRDVAASTSHDEEEKE